MKLINNSFITSLVDKLRDLRTNSQEFSKITNQISSLLLYEVIKDFPITKEFVPHWLDKEYEATKIDEHSVILVPILRAGMGMLEGARSVLSNAQISVMGMYRNEETLQPVWYYNKLQKCENASTAIILDPMLATGGSISATCDELKSKNCTKIIILAILGAPEGISTLKTNHPDAQIYIAALDEKLNEKGYIIPGLGDAGDRIFNTN